MPNPKLVETVDNLEVDITHLDYLVKGLIQANAVLTEQLKEANRLLEIYRSVAREEDNG